MFRKEMTEAMKQSNLSFIRAMVTFGSSMTAVAQTIKINRKHDKRLYYCE